MSIIEPTYYTAHPDGVFRVADPQPVAEHLQPTYALCNHSHGGNPCGDPACYLVDSHARLMRAAPGLLSALKTMVNKARKQNWNDHYPDELEAAVASIAQAEGGDV